MNNTIKKSFVKYQLISRYFQSYKELRFSSWLRKFYSFVESQSKYHSNVVSLLNQDIISKVVHTDPTPQPFPNVDMDVRLNIYIQLIT